MTSELELRMSGWTLEEKQEVYDKISRIEAKQITGNKNMFISDVINSLQSVLDEHGDLPVIYSRDDEGNDHHKVSWCGSVMYVDDIDSYYLDIIRNEYEDSEPTNCTKVVCIN